MRVRCSKGTYIRTLCEDLGKALGTGAAMQSLLRTRVKEDTDAHLHRLRYIKTEEGTDQDRSDGIVETHVNARVLQMMLELFIDLV